MKKQYQKNRGGILHKENGQYAYGIRVRSPGHLKWNLSFFKCLFLKIQEDSNSKCENSTTQLILFLATFSRQKASKTVSKWQLVAINVCIISAFSTTTKGLKRPFKNPSYMRICNNLERSRTSTFIFILRTYDLIMEVQDFYFLNILPALIRDI